ncbi:hypothetical protein, partial [Propionibacterium freudenreichii]
AVVGVRLERPEIGRTIGVIRRAGRSLSPAAAAFLEMLALASRSSVKPAKAAKARSPQRSRRP